MKHFNSLIIKYTHKLYFIFLLLVIFFHLSIIKNEISNIGSKNNNSKIQEQKLNIINKFYEIFTKLYFNFRNKMNITTNYKENISYKINQNKIMLCCIGKEENLYAKEFVEYYISLGFDKIIILDNNNLNGERFDDVLQYFIKKNIVEIIDLRGLKQIQIPSFNYCYRKYMYLYDWISFFDFDEFLFIKNYSNVKDYLYNNKFNDCQLVLFNWYIYDDNDLLRYDNRTMISRFTHFKFIPKATKFIVRGNIENLLITSPHIAINTNYCNSKGEQIFPISHMDLPIEKNSLAYIKHFYTKTAEEYCLKRKRGYVQSRPSSNKKFDINEINDFFIYNNKTINKQKILESCYNVNYYMKINFIIKLIHIFCFIFNLTSI